MSETHGSTEEHNKPGLYEFRLKGHLDARWTYCFEALSLTHESDGTTILSVQVVDQPALHGLLRKVRDLGLPLVSVIQVDPKQANSQDVNANTDPNHLKKRSQ
ncbi:hypothetical protein [Neobacillus sp.]|uniref:hypothetical protein n=1 Tax=Neobacillus sp. TaxID=2675273 RepID=UPI00289E834A|nr:hypothetical protein [Neobacillus sp.]